MIQNEIEEGIMSLGQLIYEKGCKCPERCPYHPEVPQIKVVTNGWAVIDKTNRLIGLEDVRETYKAAREYKRDAFEPEHEAQVIPITITIESRSGK
jgi:hypothetical protein